MTKRTITKLLIWNVIAWIPAGILLPSGGLALAAHHGGVNDGYGRTMLGLTAVGALFLWAGIILQLVAWVAALVNTRPLSDARWFTTLLLCGVVGILTTPLFGLGVLVLGSAMTAYVVGGPDGLAASALPTPPPKSTITHWSDRGFAVLAVGLIGTPVVTIWTNTGGPLHGHTWASLALVSAGITIAVVGGIIVCAAWWGALFNAHSLADKTWFKRLRWSGIAAAVTMPLFGFGGLILAAVLIAYRHSAPDGVTDQPPREPTRTAPPPTRHRDLSHA